MRNAERGKRNLGFCFEISDFEGFHARNGSRKVVAAEISWKC